MMHALWAMMGSSIDVGRSHGNTTPTYCPSPVNEHHATVLIPFFYLVYFWLDPTISECVRPGNAT